MSVLVRLKWIQMPSTRMIGVNLTLTRSPSRRLLFSSWHFWTCSSGRQCPGGMCMRCIIVHTNRTTMYLEFSRTGVVLFKIQNEKRCLSSSGVRTGPLFVPPDIVGLWRILFLSFRFFCESHKASRLLSNNKSGEGVKQTERTDKPPLV